MYANAEFQTTSTFSNQFGQLDKALLSLKTGTTMITYKKKKCSAQLTIFKKKVYKVILFNLMILL